MNQLMIGVSGIRGVIGEGLTPEIVCRFCAAFGQWCGKGKVLVGGDSRTSRQMLSLAATAGLLSVGRDVGNLELCPTPTLELAVKERKAAGGVIITASHNPIEYNGLKFVGPEGIFLDKAEGERVLQIFNSSRIKKVGWEGLGKMSVESGAVQVHIERILALDVIDLQLIRSKSFKVVLDTCNGAGGIISPLLLRKLGCEVVTLNPQPTGIFAHPPEPIPANLTQLCEAVTEHRADVGFANDPDVDRLAVVSEQGKAIGEEYSLALAVKLVLSKKRGPVVTNLSTSRMVDDIAAEYGVQVARTPVGEINVVKKMRQIGAVIGGEGNGGVIFPDFHPARDAQVGMALVLQLMAERDKKVSELVDSIPRYFIVKRRFEKPNLDKEKALRIIQDAYRSEKLDISDGVKIVRENSWIHVRKSNTEPLIRIITEARSRGEASLLCKEIVEKLRQC
jgi:phosphomannomutase